MGNVERVVAAVRAGRTVIIPTDTVYGLCADPARAEAVAELSRLKGRAGTTPVALVADGVDTLVRLVPELRGRPEAIARALLPGPYTLVFRNPAGRFPSLRGEGTIGVRVPLAAGAALAVLAQVGALAATSANRHGDTDPRRLEDVPRAIRDRCGAEIDGGELPGVPSTVLDLTGDAPRVLREGAIPAVEALALAATVSA